MTMFLSKEELEKFTGCRTASAQIVRLRRSRIKYYVDADGQPNVPRTETGKGLSKDRANPFQEAVDASALMSLPREPAGVYLLKLNSVVVYVGKTKNLFHRMSTHMTGMIQFDEVNFVNLPVDQLDLYEREFIAKFAPKFNIAHNKTL